jgi:ubiquitin carboxyl-terminal hydrolase L5
LLGNTNWLSKRYWAPLLTIFLSKIDILNVDLSQNDFDKWLKSMDKSRNKTKKPASNKTKKKARKMKKADDEDLAFHFIAYVPIDGSVWRFDGLQYEPLNLG